MPPWLRRQATASLSSFTVHGQRVLCVMQSWQRSSSMVDRRLGRGLDFFLSGGRSSHATPKAGPGEGESSTAQGRDQGEEVLLADVQKLVPGPYQPRKQMAESELKSLADSIRASGILQPILVRRVGDRLEIIAGERRWRAAQLAGLSQVPVLVRQI